MAHENIINDIKQGTKLSFKEASSGTVVDVWSEVMKGVDSKERVSVHLQIAHEDNSESFHTFRYDGISNHHHSHDITKVIN